MTTLYHIVLILCVLGKQASSGPHATDCIDGRMTYYHDDVIYVSLEACVDGVETRYGELLARPGWGPALSAGYCAPEEPKSLR